MDSHLIQPYPSSSRFQEFQLHYSLHYFPISKDGGFPLYEATHPNFFRAVHKQRGPEHTSFPATPGSEMSWTTWKSMGPEDAVPHVDWRGQQCVGNNSRTWEKGWEEGRGEKGQGRGKGLSRAVCLGWKDDCLYLEQSDIDTVCPLHVSSSQQRG